MYYFNTLLLCTGLFHGYFTFVLSILMIGLVTAVIGDVAGHLGCFIFLKDSVNAIAFVALGTSVPGIYSSQCLGSDTKKTKIFFRWRLSNYKTFTSYYQQSRFGRNSILRKLSNWLCWLASNFKEFDKNILF